jgi:hypothetical protein
MIAAYFFTNATVALASLFGLGPAKRAAADGVAKAVVDDGIIDAAADCEFSALSTTSTSTPTPTPKSTKIGSWWGNVQGNMYAHNHFEERGLRDGGFRW